MTGLIAPVARLIEEFSKLPGVGRKTAQRLTYHVLRAPADEARGLAEALVAVKEQVAYCCICCNITDVGVDPCAICSDDRRDATRICVVEEPLDVLAIERTGEFRGRYHVLHGRDQPHRGHRPRRISASRAGRARGRRRSRGDPRHQPQHRGRGDGHVPGRLLQPLGLMVTRIARGLPVGGDLEYADDVTLIRSFQGGARSSAADAAMRQPGFPGLLRSRPGAPRDARRAPD